MIKTPSVEESMFNQFTPQAGTTEGKQRPDPDRDRLGPDEELP